MKLIIKKKMTNKIFLIGPMGVGKTTVGKVLSNNLDYHFFDIDDKNYWKNRYKVDRHLLYMMNRDKYHDIESEILKDYSTKNNKNSIISTGGSTVLRLENKNLMKSSGRVVYLEGNSKTLDDRMKNHNDGPMKNWYNASRFTLSVRETFLNERKPYYKFADLEIDTNDKSVEEICHDIESWIC